LFTNIVQYILTTDTTL